MTSSSPLSSLRLSSLRLSSLRLPMDSPHSLDTSRSSHERQSRGTYLDESDVDDLEILSSPEISFSGPRLSNACRNLPSTTRYDEAVPRHTQAYPMASGRDIPVFPRNTNRTQAPRQSYRRREDEYSTDNTAYMQLKKEYRLLERELAFTQGELQASK